MRKIAHQISLEPLVSRLPSILPAYKDNAAYYFDERSIASRDGLYPSNYGMIPINIVLNHKPDSSVYNGEKAYENYEMETGTHCYGSNNYDIFHSFTLSFHSLSNWYHFFVEYYKLLKDYGHCGRVYTSAVDYYNYESGTKYASQMIYGIDLQTYVDLDAEFSDKGGVVWVRVFDKNTSEYRWVSPEVAHDEYDEHDGGRTAMVDVEDRGFYKWICDNVVPSYTIPKEYRDYWNRTVLYYPDVLRWIPWFQNLKGIYEDLYVEGKNGEMPKWNCKEQDDCCECEEYFNRGGARMLNALSGWNANVQETILKTSNVTASDIGEPSECLIPTIILPLTIQVSIDDLGEESIFSKDYELGVDYRTANHYESANTSVGTVVTVSGESKILTSGNGFTFDETFMEKYYDEDGFESYTDKYISANPLLNGEIKYNGTLTNNVTFSNGYIHIVGTINANTSDSFKEFTFDIKYNNQLCSTYDLFQEGLNVSCPNSNVCTCEDLVVDLYAIPQSGVSDNGIIGTYSIEKEFKINYNFYCFDDNNAIYTSTADTIDSAREDLRGQMSSRYPIITNENGWALDNEELYEILESEYGVYDKSNSYLSGKTYFVYREDGTNTPYTIINGKKIYADFYEHEMLYYFPFFPSDNPTPLEESCSGETFNISNYRQFPVIGLSDYTKKYILYNGTYYIVEDGNESVQTSTYELPIISGYCQISGDTRVYIKKNDTKVYSYYSYNILNELDTNEASIEGNDVVINRVIDFEVYNARVITGRTASKLQDLKKLNYLVDDVGNKIDGIYDLEEFRTESGKSAQGIMNHQPQEGRELELLYQVGNVYGVSRFSLTAEKTEDVTDGTNYFVGDIITQMKFYFKTRDGRILPDVTSGITLNECTPRYTSLGVIQKLTKIKDNDHDNLYEDDIYCDITYYIGATLKRTEGECPNKYDKDKKLSKRFVLANDTNYNMGVKYVETVQFVKERREYFMKKRKNPLLTLPKELIKKHSVHSVSYPVYVYNLRQNNHVVRNSIYDEPYEATLSNFYTEINVFSGNGTADTYSTKKDMETHNGMQVFPTFREEYRFGISSIENVDSDIYIDRGINASYEKHLKLGEVTSLEALEQYGLNFFKIIEG